MILGLIIVAVLGMAVVVWPVLWIKDKKRRMVERAEESMRLERAVGRIEWIMDGNARVGSYRGVTLHLIPDEVDL